MDEKKKANILLLCLTGIKLLLHLILSGRYGYFRDELYYLAAGRHLDWGYVDFAPLTAIYAKVGLLLGGSLSAIRIIPALSGAALVALVILMCRRLGGGLFAQALAGVCVLVAPAFLALDNFLSMNAVEPLLWTGAIYVLIRIVQTGNSRLWIWFGVLLGVGLENKHSAIFFGVAVFAALVLTRQRKEILKPWIWLGGLAAFAIFLPNIIWQWQHDFPTLEDLRNVQRTGKNVILGPGAFIWQQIYVLHPILFPVWIAGLVSFLRNSKLRILGYTFLIFFGLMLVMHAKNYYLFPIYPMLIAGGSMALAEFLQQRKSLSGRAWIKAAVIAVILITTVPMDIVVLPILPPEQYVRYSKFFGIGQIKTEVQHKSVWPQMFADQFGWSELVQEVNDIYQSLPAEERSRTAIFAGNYGEAGAIDLFGPQYGLPPAICAHQNYFYWGPPETEPEIMIVLQSDERDLRRYFQSIKQAKFHNQPFGMGEENGPIFLCRNPKFRLAEVWPQLKHWN